MRSSVLWLVLATCGLCAGRRRQRDGGRVLLRIDSQTYDDGLSSEHLFNKQRYARMLPELLPPQRHQLAFPSGSPRFPYEEAERADAAKHEYKVPLYRNFTVNPKLYEDSIRDHPNNLKDPNNRKENRTEETPSFLAKFLQLGDQLLDNSTTRSSESEYIENEEGDDQYEPFLSREFVIKNNYREKNKEGERNKNDDRNKNYENNNYDENNRNDEKKKCYDKKKNPETTKATETNEALKINLGSNYVTNSVPIDNSKLLNGAVLKVSKDRDSGTNTKTIKIDERIANKHLNGSRFWYCIPINVTAPFDLSQFYQAIYNNISTPRSIAPISNIHHITERNNLNDDSDFINTRDIVFGEVNITLSPTSSTISTTNSILNRSNKRINPECSTTSSTTRQLQNVTSSTNNVSITTESYKTKSNSIILTEDATFTIKLFKNSDNTSKISEELTKPIEVEDVPILKIIENTNTTVSPENIRIKHERFSLNTDRNESVVKNISNTIDKNNIFFSILNTTTTSNQTAAVKAPTAAASKLTSDNFILNQFNRFINGLKKHNINLKANLNVSSVPLSFADYGLIDNYVDMMPILADNELELVVGNADKERDTEEENNDRVVPTAEVIDHIAVLTEPDPLFLLHFKQNKDQSRNKKNIDKFKDLWQYIRTHMDRSNSDGNKQNTKS